MNPPLRVEFEPQYSQAFMYSASKEFVRGYLFVRYGKWLVLACAVNVAGVALSLSFGAEGASVWFVAAIALFGPVWLTDFYVRRPTKFAARSKDAALVERIALSQEQLEFSTKLATSSLPWSKFKAVVETPSAFLLVLSPFAFVPLPKLGMPSQFESFLEQRKSHDVA